MPRQQNKIRRNKVRNEENSSGKEAENKVEEAIKKLLLEKPLFVSYHRAIKNKEIDQLGIDFIIFLANLVAIPLQVKRGTKGIERHYRRHSNIIAIAVGQKEVGEIAGIIEELVIKILKRIAADPLKPLNPYSLE